MRQLTGRFRTIPGLSLAAGVAHNPNSSMGTIHDIGIQLLTEEHPLLMSCHGLCFFLVHVMDVISMPDLSCPDTLSNVLPKTDVLLLAFSAKSSPSPFLHHSCRQQRLSATTGACGLPVEIYTGFKSRHSPVALDYRLGCSCERFRSRI